MGVVGIARTRSASRSPVIAAGVILMAVGAFLGGEKLETIFATKSRRDRVPVSPRPSNSASSAAFAAVAVLASLVLALPVRARGAPRKARPRR